MSRNSQDPEQSESSGDKHLDDLFEKMQTPEHAAAIDTLFDITAEELGAAHAPGKTERQPEDQED